MPPPTLAADDLARLRRFPWEKGNFSRLCRSAEKEEGFGSELGELREAEEDVCCLHNLRFLKAAPFFTDKNRGKRNITRETLLLLSFLSIIFPFSFFIFLFIPLSFFLHTCLVFFSIFSFSFIHALFKHK